VTVRRQILIALVAGALCAAELAAELVRSNVDVIVATGTPVYRALKQATSTVPVVITVSADPVGEGFVASLARPGGNITGLSSRNDEVSVKHLELLKSTVPTLSRVAVLVNPTNEAHGRTLRMIEASPQKSGLRLLRADAATPDEIARAFTVILRERTEALMLLADTFFLQQTAQIAGLEMVINAKTAKAVGVTIPRSLRLQADKVIE
jgi:putative ABC transport system substrate-binding protein